MRASHILYIGCLALALTLTPPALAQKKGTLRVSGDNAWVVYVDGDKLAEGNNWQAPSATEFALKDGRAMIAIYVHDAEPGAAGRGGFLADIILDNGDYLKTGDPGWTCDQSFNKPDRKDKWTESGYDDSKWEKPVVMDQFGLGIWGFGAAAMKAVLQKPDCEAFWAWCGPNDGADDVYFRYRIGTLAVEPNGKAATVWAALKAQK